ncbi:MAG TPA: fibronectin type III domain-containing protein [Pyrinomonadaceae bacterium]
MNRAALSSGRDTASSRLLAIVLLLVLLCLASACGKRRPPLPPVERIPQRTELLSGAQRGNQVILSWPAPRRNAPEQSVQSIRRIDVYRLAESPAAPLPLTEDEFAARSTLIGSIDYETIRTAGETITYVDRLELAGQPTRLRYALRYVNAEGQRAAFSNFLLLEPAARIAEPPTVLGQEVSERAVTITWQAPATNIDGSTPVNLLGYNVYRVEKSQTEMSQTPINSALVTGTRFNDETFRFGEEYNYLVRSVSLGTGGLQVESLNSNSILVAPVDIFKPAAPGPVSIAPAPGRLSLFFPANPERDVAGYNIFRSTDPNLAKESWTKLTSTLLTRTTYQDETVEPGRQYYYYVTAVDANGNQSAPSEVVTETVP